MKIIAIGRLREFWELHPDAEQPLKAWVDEVRNAHWLTPNELKAQFRHASILKSRRVVLISKATSIVLSRLSPIVSAPCISNLSVRIGSMTPLTPIPLKGNNMMSIYPIRNDSDYQTALGQISPLFDNPPEPGTPEGDF